MKQPCVRTLKMRRAVVELVERWQKIFLTHVGHRMVFAADEYYLMADMAFPAGEDYEGFGLHEDGIGMARTFEWEFDGRLDLPTGPQSGFLHQWMALPPRATGHREIQQEIQVCAAVAVPHLVIRRGSHCCPDVLHQ